MNCDSCIKRDQCQIKSKGQFIEQDLQNRVSEFNNRVDNSFQIISVMMCTEYDDGYINDFIDDAIETLSNDASAANNRPLGVLMEGMRELICKSTGVPKSLLDKE